MTDANAISDGCEKPLAGGVPRERWAASASAACWRPLCSRIVTRTLLKYGYNRCRVVANACSRIVAGNMEAITVEIQKILAELRQEQEQIGEAILSLERLASGRHRGRGRPPKWMSEIPKKRRGRPPGSKSKPKIATQ